MMGERLQELRKDAGLSQLELAQRLSISVHTVSSYERNKSEPNDEIKIRISNLFNISLDYLIGTADFPVPPHMDSRTAPDGYESLHRDNAQLITRLVKLLLTEQSEQKHEQP